MAGKNTANIGFEKQIWDAACVLRGNMDASEYKNVVLGLIFLKYISDCFENKYQELIAEGDGFEEDMDEYISEGSEVEAGHYLVKPVKEEKVKECLERIAGMPFMVLGTEDGVYKVLQKDIIKIEVFAGQCFYTTTHGKYAVVQSLKQAQKDLGLGCFVECHRGVLVNLCHIEAVEHNRVLLTGGLEAPVSRRLYGKVNEAFIGYFRKIL